MMITRPRASFGVSSSAPSMRHGPQQLGHQPQRMRTTAPISSRPGSGCSASGVVVVVVEGVAGEGAHPPAPLAAAAPLSLMRASPPRAGRQLRARAQITAVHDLVEAELGRVDAPRVGGRRAARRGLARWSRTRPGAPGRRGPRARRPRSTATASPGREVAAPALDGAPAGARLGRGAEEDLHVGAREHDRPDVAPLGHDVGPPRRRRAAAPPSPRGRAGWPRPARRRAPPRACGSGAVTSRPSTSTRWRVPARPRTRWRRRAPRLGHGVGVLRVHASPRGTRGPPSGTSRPCRGT